MVLGAGNEFPAGVGDKQGGIADKRVEPPSAVVVRVDLEEPWSVASDGAPHGIENGDDVASQQ